MNSILLPPLPPGDLSISYGAQLRARDIEVARVVLEAAAKVCDVRFPASIAAAHAIRALGFTHD